MRGQFVQCVQQDATRKFGLAVRACNGCPLHLVSEALKLIGRLQALPQHIDPRWATCVMRLKAQALNELEWHCTISFYSLMI